jgi:O-antigen ligase
MQLSGGASAVQGTYAVKNHFAGLLEMALPFPAVYVFSVFHRAPPRGYMDTPVVGRMVLGGGLAALLATGIMISLSRGGLVAAMTSVLVMAAVATNWKMPMHRKVATACVFLLLAAAALFYLTPMTLIERFAQHNTAGRFSVWSEALGVIAQYPIAGCGLGGFESAFLRFKKIEGVVLVDYAHNDYLQSLAELGIIGFLPVALLIGSVARRMMRISDEASDIRWLGIACLGSLTAIVVHSAMDFNLYVAANAAVLAWICGMAAGITPFDPSWTKAGSAMEYGSALPRRPMPSP